MSKLFLAVIVFILALTPVKAKTLTGGVGLDWPLLSQYERTETINYYREKMFKDIPRKIDMSRFEEHEKDINYRINRKALKKDLRKLGDRELAGFYLFGKLLVIYGVKYIDDKDNVYYYNAMGNLEYVDILDKPHDRYPHIAYQYNDNGKFIGASYYLSEYDQYVYDDDGDFKGRWYFEKMYDKKAKVIMKRKLP